MGASEDPHRYFTNMELRELFQLDDPKFSSTQQQLEELHAHQRLVYPELKLHLDYLRTLDIFGISDHDLMFQGQLNDSVEQEDHDQESIRSRVEKAQLLLQLESEHVHNENLRSGAFCKDLTNFQKPPVQSATIMDSASVERFPFAPPVVTLLDNIVTELVDDERPLEPSHQSPQDSVIIEHDVSCGSVEELTEEELKDMKNISLTDPEFAKALEMSLREYKARTAEKNTSELLFSSMEDTDVKTALDESLLPYSTPTPQIIDPNEPSTSHDAELNLALQLSLKDFQAQELRKKTELTNKSSEDLDLERAIRLSLQESLARSEEEEDFAKAIEMSQAEVHTWARKENFESLPARKEEILVVDSDFLDSDCETSLPDLDQTTNLGASTSKSFLDRSLFTPAKAPPPLGQARKSEIWGIPETDEECGTSGLSSNRTSLGDSSIIWTTRPKGRRLLESSTEEDSDSSVSPDSRSSNKRTRLTPELEDLQLTSK